MLPIREQPTVSLLALFDTAVGVLGVTRCTLGMGEKCTSELLGSPAGGIPSSFPIFATCYERNATQLRLAM